MGAHNLTLSDSRACLALVRALPTVIRSPARACVHGPRNDPIAGYCLRALRYASTIGLPKCADVMRLVPVKVQMSDPLAFPA